MPDQVSFVRFGARFRSAMLTYLLWIIRCQPVSASFRKERNMLRYFTCVLWLCIFIYVMWYRLTKKRRCSIEVKATVVEVNKERQSHNGRPGRVYTYQPTFVYEWKGFTRTIQSKIRSSYLEFQPGDEVVLLIDPNDSDNFMYKSLRYDPISQLCVLFGLTTLVMIVTLIRLGIS